MRVTQAMAQIGELGGQGWGVGIVFVSSPNGPGEETVSLDVRDLIDLRHRPEGSQSNGCHHHHHHGINSNQL